MITMKTRCSQNIKPYFIMLNIVKNRTNHECSINENAKVN